MLTKSKLLAILAESNRVLVDLLWSSGEGQADPPPAPEPEPRKLRQSEMPGIDMRKMGEDALRSRPKPPRGPGMQQRRYNGSWWHY